MVPSGIWLKGCQTLRKPWRGEGPPAGMGAHRIGHGERHPLTPRRLLLRSNAMGEETTPGGRRCQWRQGETGEGRVWIELLKPITGARHSPA